MRIFLAALSSVCIFAAGSVNAASLHDPSTKDSPVYSSYAAPVWQGLYFGGFAGYAWADGTYKEYDGDGVESKPLDLDGGLFGVQIGYDFQRGQYVFGIVGDYSWLNSKDVERFGRDANKDGVGDFSRTVEIHSLATLRGRLGYAFDGSLLYATAGVAFVGVDTDACIGGSPPGCSPKKSFDDSYTSWVVGAGYERQLGDGISFFAEYLYIGDGDVDPSKKDSTGFDGPVVIDDISVLKAGLNFRLGHERESLK